MNNILSQMEIDDLVIRVLEAMKDEQTDIEIEIQAKEMISTIMNNVLSQMELDDLIIRVLEAMKDKKTET